MFMNQNSQHTYESKKKFENRVFVKKIFLSNKLFACKATNLNFLKRVFDRFETNLKKKKK